MKTLFAKAPFVDVSFRVSVITAINQYLVCGTVAVAPLVPTILSWQSEFSENFRLAHANHFLAVPAINSLLGVTVAFRSVGIIDHLRSGGFRDYALIGRRGLWVVMLTTRPTGTAKLELILRSGYGVEERLYRGRVSKLSNDPLNLSLFETLEISVVQCGNDLYVFWLSYLMFKVSAPEIETLSSQAIVGSDLHLGPITKTEDDQAWHPVYTNAATQPLLVPLEGDIKAIDRNNCFGIHYPLL